MTVHQDSDFRSCNAHSSFVEHENQITDATKQNLYQV